MRRATMMRIPIIPLLLSGAIAAVCTIDAGMSQARASEDLWPGLRKEIFADRDIVPAGTTFSLFVPGQAADAALVPVSIRLPDAVARQAKTLTIVIDRNPAPVAATFEFGDGFRESVDIGKRLIETRIRVDSFSQLRAVLETKDGTLHMAAKFVAGAGGCSAPSSKDAEAALAGLGKIKIDLFREPGRGEAWRDARVMIRHPNFTGMQMDPISRGYTPARYVDSLEVRRNGAMAFRMTGGISLSENPHFRFSFGSERPEELIEVLATDSDGARFSDSSLAKGS